jgi:protein SCO1/2
MTAFQTVFTGTLLLALAGCQTTAPKKSFPPVPTAIPNRTNGIPPAPKLDLNLAAAAEPKKIEPPAAVPPAATPAPVKPASSSFLQAYATRGVIKELKPDGQTAVITHEEIPGFMPAMTMPFVVHDPKELAGLQAGDTVTFQMIISGDDGWIEQLVKQDVAPAPTLPGPLRVVRDVEPLKEGDALPDYTFTAENGSALKLSQFKGQAVALTFIFTRCPFPTFCPLLSRNFTETQDKLKKSPVTNWHLLTLSFDPQFDTPAVLKTYAAAQHADPARWNFLTGELMDITALTEQFGVQFWRENPAEPISHNLRTVVVAATGRIQKILPNNNWTSDELVAEMLRAAAAK